MTLLSYGIEWQLSIWEQEIDGYFLQQMYFHIVSMMIVKIRIGDVQNTQHSQLKQDWE